MTLSEGLALRAQAAAEAEARERVRLRNLRTLEALDAEPMCTCPACTRARALRLRHDEGFSQQG